MHNIEFVREDDVNPYQAAMNRLIALSLSIHLISGVSAFLHMQDHLATCNTANIINCE